MDTGVIIITWLIFAAILIGAMVLALRINKFIFKRIRKKNNSLHYMYIEKLITAAIIICFIVSLISMFAGTDNIWKSVLGSTAVISAVAGLAAQDTLKNVLAGMILSIHKPFDIGDRIILDDGTAGIVKKMNMRHVELVGIDIARVIIPNSQINTMRIKNHNFNSQIRSVYLKFRVGYGCDVNFAKKVILDAVKESEYSLPRPVKSKDADDPYGKVYFIEFGESCLFLGITVYFENTHATEIVMNEINTRVRDALIKNGIEIPYPYMNVVTEEIN